MQFEVDTETLQNLLSVALNIANAKYKECIEYKSCLVALHEATPWYKRIFIDNDIEYFLADMDIQCWKDNIVWVTDIQESIDVFNLTHITINEDNLAKLNSILEYEVT